MYIAKYLYIHTFILHLQQLKTLGDHYGTLDDLKDMFPDKKTGMHFKLTHKLT